MLLLANAWRACARRLRSLPGSVTAACPPTHTIFLLRLFFRQPMGGPIFLLRLFRCKQPRLRPANARAWLLHCRSRLRDVAYCPLLLPSATALPMHRAACVKRIPGVERRSPARPDRMHVQATVTVIAAVLVPLVAVAVLVAVAAVAWRRRMRAPAGSETTEVQVKVKEEHRCGGAAAGGGSGSQGSSDAALSPPPLDLASSKSSALNPKPQPGQRLHQLVEADAATAMRRWSSPGGGSSSASHNTDPAGQDAAPRLQNLPAQWTLQRVSLAGSSSMGSRSSSGISGSSSRPAAGQGTPSKWHLSLTGSRRGSSNRIASEGGTAAEGVELCVLPSDSGAGGLLSPNSGESEAPAQSEDGRQLQPPQLRSRQWQPLPPSPLSLPLGHLRPLSPRQLPLPQSQPLRKTFSLQLRAGSLSPRQQQQQQQQQRHQLSPRQQAAAAAYGASAGKEGTRACLPASGMTRGS